MGKILLACFVMVSLNAQGVILKSGSKYEGKILERNETGIIIETTAGTVTIPWEKIESIGDSEGAVLVDITKPLETNNSADFIYYNTRLNDINKQLQNNLIMQWGTLIGGVVLTFAVEQMWVAYPAGFLWGGLELQAKKLRVKKNNLIYEAQKKGIILD
ncbi:MAG: hypothetical protein ISR95_01070 [Candidatus Marinimicrobia bacterium]|nr:hypothetical protein [Candidatus Brocadiales bacterium]MBL7046221.1 hypothetical protein [Candidatus Neomarinimicrobiota bacterium]